jgi:hypothetical protein
LSVEALTACKALAGEFRQLNLQDVWKDDVLQLNAQLYHACMSLRRPLEENRLEFQQVEASNAAKEANEHHAQAKATKRKHREDEEDKPNAKRHYKYSHCNNENRSFFDHGFLGHL